MSTIKIHKSIVVAALSFIIVMAVCYLSGLLPLTAADMDTVKDQETEKVSIIHVATRAVEITYGALNVLPAEYSSSKIIVPEYVQSDLILKADKEIETVFSDSSGLLTDHKERVRDMMKAQANSDLRDLGGGVISTDKENLVINGTTATYEADIRFWTSYQTEGNTCKAEVVKHFVIDLEEDNGQWKVTEMTSDYLPGQEP